ncbi:hypothetical protein A3Q56_03537 [Intoshia linei]|uniref:Uncharacterized protein n=1 Tax=Intoshia linei TaxID=1819745 RepID=A0A177B373_9BILA|nr:hypothetical protein A3Q56_03537 [Intoshia linei]
MECMYKMDNQIYKRFCMPYTHLKENTQMQFLAMGQQSSYADKLYNSDESIDNFSLDTDNSDLNSRKFRKLTLNFDDNDPLITVIPENLVENTRQNKKLNTSSLFRSFSCSPVIQKQNDVSQYKNDEMFEFFNFLDDQNIDIGYYLFDSAPLIDIKSDHCYATKNLINSLSKLKEANRENVQYNLFLNSFCTPPHKNLVRKEKCNLKLLDTYKNRFLRIQKLAIDESSLIFRLITSLVQKVSCVRSSKKDICKKYTRKDISKKLNMRSRFTNIYKKPLRRYNSSLLPANPTELENFSLRQKYFRKCNNVNYISSYLDSFSVQDQNESVLNTKLFNFKKGYNQLDKNSLCYRLLLRSNN